MNEVKSPKKPLMYYYAIVILVILALNFLAVPWLSQRQVKEVDYGTFMTMTENQEIGRVEVQNNQILFTNKDDTQVYKTGLMDDPDLIYRLKDSGAEFSSEIVEQMSPFLSFLLTWLLLRRACREVWGLDDVPEVSQGEHGKPYFADYPDLHFNLSHCTKGAACVVSDRPVGIDIETLQAPHEQLSRHVLSAAEYDAMMASERPDVSFTRLWTMKESLSKLSGYGLTTDWPRLQHLLDDHPEARFTTIVAVDRNYVCTICEENK